MIACQGTMSRSDPVVEGRLYIHEVVESIVRSFRWSLNVFLVVIPIQNVIEC